MLRGRSTLVSVFLCSVSLLAVASQHPGGNCCSRDLVQRVKTLRNRTLNQMALDTSLYTPNITTYENCPSGALKCFAEEVKVLIQELNISSSPPLTDRVSRPLLLLARRINEDPSAGGCRREQPKRDCTQCEVLQEENVETFLSRLEMVIDAVNTKYC